MTDVELRTWAEAHLNTAFNGPLASAVLRVLEDRDAARAKLVGLAERCHGQSEALARAARRTGAPLAP